MYTMYTKTKNPLLDHKKSYFSRITRNFDVTYSVIGSWKEGNQFLWIVGISQHLGVAYCSWKPKAVTLNGYLLNSDGW